MVGTYRIFDKCSNPLGYMRRGAPVGEAVIEGAGEGQCRSHDSLPISGYGFIGDGAHLRRRGGDAEERQRMREGT